MEKVTREEIWPKCLIEDKIEISPDFTIEL